jgi:hypothetical protein
MRARLIIQRTLKSRPLSSLALYDVARNIWQAVVAGAARAGGGAPDGQRHAAELHPRRAAPAGVRGGAPRLDQAGP